MKLNKSYDRLTQALSLSIKEAGDYGEEGIKEMLALIMQFYINDEERKFHKFFIEVVDRYKRPTDF
tara:strand:+ start:231 stop:428 length:198 start_codon:yes stop_codon:yes gene_type:complete